MSRISTNVPSDTRSRATSAGAVLLLGIASAVAAAWLASRSSEASLERRTADRLRPRGTTSGNAPAADFRVG